MSNILREYKKDGYHFIEYTKDGKAVSATTRTLISAVVPEPIEPQPSLEEMQAQTLLNTEVLIAMKNIGV